MLRIAIFSLVVVAVGVAVLLAYAATRPDRFHIARSVIVDAPPEKIFPLINDLLAFNTWNPFERQDPDTRGAYSGPRDGVGAVYAFDGAKAGTGRVEIVEAVPASRVTMRLVMVKPLAADNRVDFTLEPEGDRTRVTWAMEGGTPFVGKVLQVFLSMDRMVGRQFEAGLADLKEIAER